MKFLVVWLASYTITCWSSPSPDPYTGRTPFVFGTYDCPKDAAMIRYRWFNSEEAAKAFIEKMPKTFPHFITQSNKLDALKCEDATEYDVMIKPPTAESQQ